MVPPMNPRFAHFREVGLILLSSFLIPFVCSCGPAPDSPNASEDGCWWFDPRDAWETRLTPVFQMAGGLPGDSVVFERITDLVVGPNNSLYIVDGGAATAWVFDLDGRYIRRIGREGEGPGEFRYPLAAGVREDGSILIVDGSRWTVSMFDSLGSVITAYALEPQPPIGIVEIEVTSEHEIFTVGYHRFGASLNDSLGTKRKGLVRGEATLQQWDPVANRWKDRTELPGLEVFADVSQMKLIDIPFGGKGLWSVGEDGSLWVADNRSNTIHAVGTPTCVTIVGMEPTPVTEVDRERFFLAKDLDGAGRDRQAAVRQDRREVELPHEKPVLAALVFGSDSTIWVKLSGENANSMQDRWLAINASGGMPAEMVRLPRGLDVYHVTEDLVAGVRRGDLDIPIVEVFLRTHQE